MSVQNITTASFHRYTFVCCYLLLWILRLKLFCEVSDQLSLELYSPLHGTHFSINTQTHRALHVRMDRLMFKALQTDLHSLARSLSQYWQSAALPDMVPSR